MIRGILQSIALYAIGFFIAWLASLTYGEHAYAHVPPPHYFIIFFTVIIGCVWMVGGLVYYVTSQKSQAVKGNILMHFVALLCFAVFVYDLIYRETHGHETAEPNVNTITIDTLNKITTLHHGGNLVYYKVRDSVKINFIDSSKVDWNKAQIEYREIK
jgi:hypothetical protein